MKKRHTNCNKRVTEELQAAEKKAWLFVGRLTDTTTTEKIVRYLTRNGISGSIDCAEIPTRGTSKAFKVGIPYDQLKNNRSNRLLAEGCAGQTISLSIS